MPEAGRKCIKGRDWLAKVLKVMIFFHWLPDLGSSDISGNLSSLQVVAATVWSVMCISNTINLL